MPLVSINNIFNVGKWGVDVAGWVYRAGLGYLGYSANLPTKWKGYCLAYLLTQLLIQLLMYLLPTHSLVFLMINIIEIICIPSSSVLQDSTCMSLGTRATCIYIYTHVGTKITVEKVANHQIPFQIQPFWDFLPAN